MELARVNSALAVVVRETLNRQLQERLQRSTNQLAELFERFQHIAREAGWDVCRRCLDVTSQVTSCHCGADMCADCWVQTQCPCELTCADCARKICSDRCVVCVRCAPDQVQCTLGHTHCRVHCGRCAACRAPMCPRAAKRQCADGLICEDCVLIKPPTHCALCTVACARCVDRVVVACEHCSSGPRCDRHGGRLIQCPQCPRAWCGCPVDRHRAAKSLWELFRAAHWPE